MMRAGLIPLVVAVAFIAAACGDDRPERDLPAAVPVESSGCSPVTYGGEGRPDFLIAVATVLQGQFSGHGVQVSQAMKLVLDDRGWRAGDYSVGLQICGETTASGDAASPERCRRNARAFARNRSVIVVHGPQFSTCAQEMIPILNRAPVGPLALIAAGPTYLGLTRDGPGVGAGEPERYSRRGRRNFLRIAPPDDATAAAGAVFAQREGARRVFVLDDREPYGFGVAEAFALASENLGLTVVGRGTWDPKATHYRSLARRVQRSGADAVYLGGIVFNNGPRLIKDLRAEIGRDPQLLGPDGFNQLEPIVEGAGAAAEGFAPMISVLPTAELPAEGREFAAAFEERFGARPCCFSVHSGQATHMMLDAIADSDGSRAQVLDNLFHARVQDSYVGDFEIDRYGDPTRNTIAVYQIEDGRLRFRTAIDPPAELLARK
ncbi:MAG TPA: branched-chain amino acid ABC transporter substrate-binding protein [Thermoleophilaceae bacterium]|nr:branched-chain amino acid ABC transporter substrate-binding protein [Thermoleophilaceae bacterium]